MVGHLAYCASSLQPQLILAAPAGLRCSLRRLKEGKKEEPRNMAALLQSSASGTLIARSWRSFQLLRNPLPPAKWGGGGTTAQRTILADSRLATQAEPAAHEASAFLSVHVLCKARTPGAAARCTPKYVSDVVRHGSRDWRGGVRALTPLMSGPCAQTNRALRERPLMFLFLLFFFYCTCLCVSLGSFAAGSNGMISFGFSTLVAPWRSRRLGSVTPRFGSQIRRANGATLCWSETPPPSASQN